MAAMSEWSKKPLFPHWDVRTAWLLCEMAHKGQVDKVGLTYSGHPARVMWILKRMPEYAGLTNAQQEHASMAALLHDVLEDTSFTADILESIGCPPPVVETVVTLTRTDDLSPADYYRAIRKDPVALLVKSADIADNCDPLRLTELDEKTHRRLEKKYEKARKALGIPEGKAWYRGVVTDSN